MPTPSLLTSLGHAWQALLAEYPAARRKIRRMTYQLAFCRAMVTLARVFTREEASGRGRLNMIQALTMIREVSPPGLLP